jgi:hypothetical protein
MISLLSLRYLEPNGPRMSSAPRRKIYFSAWSVCSIRGPFARPQGVRTTVFSRAVLGVGWKAWFGTVAMCEGHWLADLFS